MKYGIYFAYWTHEWFADYKKYIEKASELGFDILEISCAAFNNNYTTDEQLIRLREFAKEKGVALTAGYGPPKTHCLCSPDPAVVENAKTTFRSFLAKLGLMDIRVLGGGLYSYWPVDYTQPVNKPEDWKRAVSGIKEIAKVAEQYNVTLGMEVLNRFEGYLLNTCEEALAFVDEVNSPAVKIMLDTFHMSIEEDSIPGAIRLAGDKLGHLHIGERNRKVPGKGSVPWGEIGIALRDIKYSGAAVMEPFVLSGGTIGTDIKVWRDLVANPTEETLDRDAKGALEFIQHVFAG